MPLVDQQFVPRVRCLQLMSTVRDIVPRLFRVESTEITPFGLLLPRSRQTWTCESAFEVGALSSCPGRFHIKKRPTGLMRLWGLLRCRGGPGIVSVRWGNHNNHCGPLADHSRDLWAAYASQRASRSTCDEIPAGWAIVGQGFIFKGRT